MRKAIDLTGQVFGNWTVIERSGSDKHGKALWLVKCSCEQETAKTVVGSQLTRGNSKSCGCGQALEKGKAARNMVACRCQRQAAERNLECKLSDKEFDELFAGNCFYCGTPPSNKLENKAGNGSFIYSGIDRVNNAEGYSRGNCVSCCKICNGAKSSMPLKDFIQWIERAHNHIKPMLAPRSED